MMTVFRVGSGRFARFLRAVSCFHTVNGFRLDQTGLMSVCERIALQRSGWPCHRCTIAVCTLCATKVHKVRWHHVPPSVTPPRQDGDVSAEIAGRRQPIIAPARRNVSNSRLMSCSERTKQHIHTVNTINTHNVNILHGYGRIDVLRVTGCHPRIRHRD